MSGGGETTIEGARLRLSVDDTGGVSPGSKVAVRYGASYRQLVLRLAPEAARRKLEALVGHPLPRAIEFERGASFRSPALQSLRRMIRFLVAEMESSEARFAPAALAEFEQALIDSFLRGRRRNFSNLLESPSGSLARWQVRLTGEYIAAHRNAPLTLEAISAAVGISARTICPAFQASRGHTPMAFVKALRLGRAQTMLREARTTATVADVAYSSGFRSHGRFAGEYKRRFGELPSETLDGRKRHEEATPSPPRARRRDRSPSPGGFVGRHLQETPADRPALAFRGARPYCRYCWMRVVRRPARPNWSIDICQLRNSSTVSV